jgi:ABC-type sugar transport system ATPase subunit
LGLSVIGLDHSPPSSGSPLEEGGPLLEVRGAGKSFPGVQALRDVSLAVRRGEVVALVGQNGAGKSTLIKALTGAGSLDSGTIEFAGEKVESMSLRRTRRLGIGAVYQELTIVPELSAVRNVYLEDPPRRGPFVNYREMKKRFRDLAGRVGAGFSADAKAGALSVADQQLIEIMRALARQHMLLIMDEPTAALGHHEREHLHGVVKGLAKSGIGVIFISHDLDEVLELADQIVVLRDGAVVGEGPAGEWTKTKLVSSMLGGARAVGRERGEVDSSASEDELLEVRDLTVPGRVYGVSFSVRRGEILGIAGLVGSGRTELLRALAGADRGCRGTIARSGQSRRLPQSVKEGMRAGIGLSPEDRKLQGLVLGRSAAYNAALASMGSISKHGYLSTAEMRGSVEQATASVGFDSGRLGFETLGLSGGNQQKLVLARWLAHECELLLLDEPTRGVDVGSKEDIYTAVRGFVVGGRSAIFVSSELDEVVDVSDRVLIMHGGRLIGEMSGAEATIEKVLRLIFAVDDAVAEAVAA